MAGYGQIHTLSLPSGNKVKVRRGSILTLVQAGVLPGNLIGAVWEIFGKGNPPSPAELAQDPEKIRTMAAMMEASLRAVLVQPEVTDGDSETGTDAEGFTTGKVNPRDVPDNDKVLLFGFIQGVVKGDADEQAEEAALRKFPAEPGREAAGSGGEAVRATPEPAAPAPVEEPASARS